MADQAAASPIAQRGRRLAGEFTDLAVVRAALSERQLYEVMVDFWTNHFNVYVAKGADRFLTPDYIEHTIRPRAMGKFEDLLIATARSPRCCSTSTIGRAWRPAPSHPRPSVSAPRAHAEGINENYARELLELHTLSVDGGYTQQDVIDVARIFTGWSIERPNRAETSSSTTGRMTAGKSGCWGQVCKRPRHGRRDPAPQASGQPTRPRCTT